jgi:hypothetical protein
VRALRGVNIHACVGISGMGTSGEARNLYHRGHWGLFCNLIYFEEVIFYSYGIIIEGLANSSWVRADPVNTCSSAPGLYYIYMIRKKTYR